MYENDLYFIDNFLLLWKFDNFYFKTIDIYSTKNKSLKKLGFQDFNGKWEKIVQKTGLSMDQFNALCKAFD